MPFVGRGRAARGKCCGAPQVARRSRMSGERLLSAAQFTGCFPLALSPGAFQWRFPAAFSGGADWSPHRAWGALRRSAQHSLRHLRWRAVRVGCANAARVGCVNAARIGRAMLRAGTSTLVDGSAVTRGWLRRHSWPRPCGPLRSPFPVRRLEQVPSPEPDARVRAGVGGGLRTRPPVRCRDPGSGWPSDRET